MITYHLLLNEGKDRLMNAGYSEQSALLLLNEYCRHYGVNLYMEMESEASETITTDFLEGVHLMERGIPLAYVLGYENFYGYDFIVNEDVLIPRPETEELVGLVLQLCDEVFPQEETLNVFDVATGSGAIGVTLSLEDPRMDVIASDLSRKALQVAWRNNQNLKGRCQFIEGSMLDPYIDRDLHCDVLVCNPPYIPDDEVMESSVVDHEPHMALFGGKDGLHFYRDVFKKARQVLNRKAVLCFEMGYNQGQRLSNLAASYFPEAKIEVHQDLSGKDRMLSVLIDPEKA